jgi:hypothetical protein
LADLNETAYPRLKTHYTVLELDEIFNPTPDEITLCDKVARGDRAKTYFLVTFKVFQRLGYFLFIRDTPELIVQYFARRLNIRLDPGSLSEYDLGRTRPNHMASIRQFCGVSVHRTDTRKALVQAVVEAAKSKDDLADIINVAIEELVRQRFELPAFGTIHRAAKSARGTVNRGFHRKIAQALSSDQKSRIDGLFTVAATDFKSAWDSLKYEPGKPSKTHFRELLQHLKCLEGFPVFNSGLYAGIPTGKLTQFSGEAKSLDSARMAALAPQKRYALAATMIRFQRARCLDNLAEMFIKRMMKIHHNGEEALNQYHIEHQATTDRLLLRFQDVLQAYHYEGTSDERIEAVSQAIGKDEEKLAADLQAQLALSGNNYYSFLDRYYKPYRSILFDLIASIELVSTTQDSSVIDAIQFAKDHQETRSEKLPVPETFKLAWIPDTWLKLVTGRSKRETGVTEIFHC